MSAASEALRDEGTRSQVVVAGAFAGLISRFCIAPLDVIKIRLQLHYHSLSDPLSQPLPTRSQHHHPSVLTVARNIFHHEGLRGFWKGNIPAEALYLSYGAAQFLAYRSTTQALDSLSHNTSLPIPAAAKSFTAGAVAGTAATTLTYPLDLLRTRFAAQGPDRVYASLLASVRDITRTEGPAGFFRGVGAGIAQIVPYMGLFFALYENLKPLAAEIQLPFGSGDAVAGVTASVLSKSAVYPLDTVRKRLQVQGPMRGRYVGGRIPVYGNGVLGTLGVILRREGVRGLYRGLSVGLAKAAPASAVTMWSYERALLLIRRLGEEGVEG